MVNGSNSVGHWFCIFYVVACFCRCDFRVGISWIVKYVYVSFCDCTGNRWPLYMMQDA